MQPTVNSSEAIALNSGTNVAKTWIPVLLFAVLWVDLVHELSFQWDASDQYAYGWFVPFLSLALFWRRWTTRPDPNAVKSPLWLGIGAVLIALFLLPIRVVHEINIDWPLTAWALTMAVVGLSLYAVFLMGGWVWFRYFMFPVCFILIAVPWPYRIEHGLTQGLMRLVAALTVELLGWVNIPAFQHGNLIEVSTGVVGISEACSGIRSFQSTLMATLFLGELYRLNWPRRFLLLFSGIAIAFCFNVVRTLTLTWRASSAGLEALEKWHDPAGMIIFLISFFCVWVIAMLIRSRAGEGPQTTKLTVFAPVPVRYLAIVGCWSICILGLTDLWYRSHDGGVGSSGMFYWTANFPTNNLSLTMIETDPRTRSILRNDEGSEGQWNEEDGTQWREDYFRWNPGPIRSIIAARLHRPDVCLPAAGLTQVEDAGVKYYDAVGLKIPFREYVYDSNGKTLHVFFCQWEDGAEKQAGLSSSKGGGRFEAAMTGRLHMGQQTLEMILSGYTSLGDAEQALRKRLPDLIRVTTTGAQARVDG